MAAPKIGERYVQISSYGSGERKIKFKRLQSFVDMYWGVVVESDDPIKELISFLNKKSSNRCFDLVPDVIVHKLLKDFKSGNFEAVKRNAENKLKFDPENIEIEKLLAISCAYVGEYTQSRKHFLNVLHKTPNNRITLINYFTACLQDGDGDAALRVIELHIDLFSNSEKKYLAENLKEGLKNNIVDYDLLTEEMKELFHYLID